MAAEVGELSVGSEADLALEGLHAAVDVLVLLQTAGRGERFAALCTGVLPGALMTVTEMLGEVGRLREGLLTVLTDKRTTPGQVLQQTQGVSQKNNKII